MDSISKLRKAVKKRNVDDFIVGTVVRWTASNRYTYAAIKTQIGWFTTARSINSFVPQQLDYEELVEILARAETTDVAVATMWDTI